MGDKVATRDAGNRVVLYTTADGKVTVDVVFESETFWLTQRAMTELFGVQKAAIGRHLKNIFESGELTREATVSKMETVRREGEREVARSLEIYNLDAVIAVGYRVNSVKATHFRIWATQALRELIIKARAHEQYDRFREQQDRAFTSDFDRTLAKYLKGRDEP